MTLIRERFRGYSDRESVHETPPNHAVEPTASSFGFAYASGGGSPPAFGGEGFRGTRAGGYSDAERPPAGVGAGQPGMEQDMATNRNRSFAGKVAFAKLVED
jgi:hypothetical protein